MLSIVRYSLRSWRENEGLTHWTLKIGISFPSLKCSRKRFTLGLIFVYGCWCFFEGRTQHRRESSRIETGLNLCIPWCSICKVEQIESTSIVGREEEVKKARSEVRWYYLTINTFHEIQPQRNGGTQLSTIVATRSCRDARHFGRQHRRGFAKGSSPQSASRTIWSKHGWVIYIVSNFFAHSKVLRSWEELVMQWGTNFKFFLTKSHKIIKLLWRILGIQSFRSTNTQRNVRNDQRTRD